MRISKEGIVLAEYAEMAGMLDISKRTAERLASDGILVEKKSVTKKKEFDLAASVKAYLQYLEREREKDSPGKRRLALEEKRVREDIEGRRVKRELNELRRDIAAGNYIAITVVRQDYQKFFALFKQFAMGLPERVGMKLKGKISLEDQRVIESEIASEVAAKLRLFVLSAALPGEALPETSGPRRATPRRTAQKREEDDV